MADGTESMLAAVYEGNRTIAVHEVAVPPVGPGQVLLEVSHCGICGTDLHMIMEDWGRPGSVYGHEYSGTVVRVGGEADGWIPGDRAVGGPNRGCGGCEFCRAGRSNLCAGRPRSGIDPFFGAFARYKVVDAEALYRVPDTTELRTAALTEPLSVALRGVRRAGVGPGARALVTGAGPIGLLTVAVLRDNGIEDVTVSEPVDKRRVLAVRAGARTVIDPGDLASPPLPMDVVDEPFDAAFECSGRADAMEAALANLARAGTLVLSGTGMRRPRFDPNRIILNELTITGTMEYTSDDYIQALELLGAGRLPAELLIEPEDQPLSRLQSVVERLSRGELAGKVMVVPHA